MPEKVGQLLWSTEDHPETVPDRLEIREKYRKAAEVHRKVREYARTKISPGVDLFEVAEDIEAFLRTACGNKGAESMTKSKMGQAFPLGLSVNHCAAHFSPLSNDTYVVTDKDIVKVDFGVHYDGYIIDSAFSMHWDPKLDVICQASKEATDIGIKTAGVDVPLSELGKAIEEVITSFEYEGKPIQPVRNLCGHQVDRYCIHAGRSIPLHKGSKDHSRMKDGEVYACETFASTGKGEIHEEYPTSHFMLAPQAVKLPLAAIKGTAAAKTLFTTLKTSFSTLAWCPRWLDTMKIQNYGMSLGSLVKSGYVNDYPKLNDKKGCYVSQFEHTFMVADWGKEVFSRGDDY
ncbi:Methionine aminopeptidase [Spironucleus salmonicida]|uniref:Methionine aminopeptidase n=1 Tax=Spironucleus salmonicida TaxID=348837 RepID=V6LT20_9EUKA|nr:Methionine aminopeptidase [Spironucleus salmonicida]|eukprot:EST47403.1 Methionine aminopeptidase [Spironucleus salmonicida]